MVKKILVIVILLAFSGYLLTPFSPCDYPIKYRIGSVDPKFKLSEQQFKSNIDRANKIWSDAYGKQLFIADPEGSLTISMLYDGRQKLSTEINQLENQLNQEKEDLEPKIQQYEKDSAAFKAKLDQLNQEIDSWNKKGGAAPEVYDELIRRQQQLKEESEKLNAQAKLLNRTTDNYNTQVNKLDQSVDRFNQSLQFKPEEGIYDPARNAIEVYFYTNQNELTHTLAHEMGHALGMEHNENTKSILFPKTTNALSPSEDDLNALHEACRQRTSAEVLRDRLIVIKDFYFNHPER